ncbi:PREDICTED: protein ASPARTIC PROTEASE IN GUARD CELL 2-like [Fragaria vesca subsp. vesca]
MSAGSQCSSAANTCVYEVIYGDESHTNGVFSKDKLTLTPADVFDGFLFGCGQDNEGFHDGSAGLLGLSATTSSTGYLSFGSPTGASNAAIKYTRLTTLSSGSTYYGLNLVGINVNGQKLSIPASVFSSPGTIIDSGTVISRLPPTAFSALRDAFQAAMTSYPSVPGDGFLDTCYDLNCNPTVTYPKIEFVFGDGVTLTLDATGIVYLLDGTMKQVCLAFVGNDDADELTIFGNTQQKNMEVLYDVAGERVGFAPGGC